MRLQGGSPCIDAADNTAATTGDLDLVGNPRFVDDTCASDDGAADGVNPPVDMGAYEFMGTSPSPNPADVNGDCEVGFPDLLLLLQLWGPCPGPPADCPADINGSGTVDIIDFKLLLASWT